MTTTSSPDRLRVNLAVLAHLTLDGHVERSGAYNANADTGRITLQGEDGDRMLAVAVDLDLEVYEIRDGYDHHVWSGVYHGVRLELTATSAPTKPVLTLVEDDALTLLAAEVTP